MYIVDWLQLCMDVILLLFRYLPPPPPPSPASSAFLLSVQQHLKEWLHAQSSPFLLSNLLSAWVSYQCLR